MECAEGSRSSRFRSTHCEFVVRLYAAKSFTSHVYWGELVVLPSGQDRLLFEIELQVGL